MEETAAQVVPPGSPFWSEALHQAPILVICLVALGFIVQRFLTAMGDRDDKFTDTLQAIGTECHEHAVAREERMLEALKGNQTILTESATALGRAAQAIDRAGP